eukprot:12222-Heterococcus_DN1.PRE.1
MLALEVAGAILGVASVAAAAGCYLVIRNRNSSRAKFSKVDDFSWLSDGEDLEDPQPHDYYYRAVPHAPVYKGGTHGGTYRRTVHRTGSFSAANFAPLLPRPGGAGGMNISSSVDEQADSNLMPPPIPVHQQQQPQPAVPFIAHPLQAGHSPVYRAMPSPHMHSGAAAPAAPPKLAPRRTSRSMSESQQDSSPRPLFAAYHHQQQQQQQQQQQWVHQHSPLPQPPAAASAALAAQHTEQQSDFFRAAEDEPVYSSNRGWQQQQHAVNTPPPGSNTAAAIAAAQAATVKQGLRNSSPLYKRERLLTGSVSAATAAEAAAAASAVTAAAGAGATAGAARRSSEEQAAAAVTATVAEENESLLQQQQLEPAAAAGRNASGVAAGAFAIAFSELEFGKLVGGGGFGQVYQGRWRGTPVAIKVLIQAAQNEYCACAAALPSVRSLQSCELLVQQCAEELPLTLTAQRRHYVYTYCVCSAVGRDG